MPFNRSLNNDGHANAPLLGGQAVSKKPEAQRWYVCCIAHNLQSPRGPKEMPKLSNIKTT